MTTTGSWKLEGQLGSGGFGIVHVWKDVNSDRRIALKECRFPDISNLSSKHKEAWKNEVDILLRLNHRNVVKCFPIPEHFKSEDEGGLPILCMEFCSGGDLRKCLNKTENVCGLTEQKEVLNILGDLTSALGYLHNRRIIHRDLKPENVVLNFDPDEKKLVYKLIDLGYAKELDSSSLAISFVGTLQYIAPELFMGSEYTKSVDYWSLGLIAHEIITGQRPFLPHHSPGQWMTFVENKSYDVICIDNVKEDGEPDCREQFFPENSISESLSDDLVSWCRLLLQYDSTKRGRSEENGGDIAVFKELKEILNKRRCRIICMDSCRHKLDYVIDDDKNNLVKELCLFIEKKLKIPSNDQLVIDSLGNRIGAYDSLLNERNRESDNLIYVCDTRINHNVAEKVTEFSFIIPKLLKKVLKNPKVEVTIEETRRIFSHSYYFTKQEHLILENLRKGLNCYIEYLTTSVKNLNSLHLSVNKSYDKIFAKYELFFESLYHDIEKYKEQAQRKERITSNKIFDSWIVCDSQIKPHIQNMKEKINATESEIQNCNSSVTLCQQIANNHSNNNNNNEFVKKSLKSYENIRKLPISRRSDEKGSVMEVAGIIAKCLKQRDKNLQDHFNIFNQHILNLHHQINELNHCLENLRIDLEYFDSNITKLQRKRQSDVWKLLTAALQQTGHPHTPPPPHYTSQSYNSISTSINPTINMHLPSISSSSVNEIIEENRMLRSNVQELMDNTFDDSMLFHYYNAGE